MNTPRTDAERRRLKKAKAYPPDPVSAEFARQLETELAAMTALADRLAEALDFTMNGNSAKDQTPFIDASCEALTAYENHKKENTP